MFYISLIAQNIFQNIFLGLILWLIFLLLERLKRSDAELLYRSSLALQFALFAQFWIQIFTSHASVNANYNNNTNNFNSLYSVSIIIYCLLFSYKLMRLLYQTYVDNRQYKQSNYLHHPQLEAAANAIARRLGLKKKTYLYVKDQLTSPFTKGFWKPIIVLPMAAVNNLSMEQMEAILWHEFIHIKRFDYLINLFQIAIELILCFNPFVYLLGRYARYYREESCDLQVLQYIEQPIAYAESLLFFAKRNATTYSSNIIQALSNQSNKLLKKRISIILSEHGIQKHHTSLRNKTLGLGLLLLSIISVNHISSIGSTSDSQTTKVTTKKEPEIAKQQSEIFRLQKPMPTSSSNHETNKDKIAEKHTSKAIPNIKKEFAYTEKNKQKFNKKEIQRIELEQDNNSNIAAVTVTNNENQTALIVENTAAQSNTTLAPIQFKTRSADSLRWVVNRLVNILQQKGEQVRDMQEYTHTEMHFSRASYEPNVTHIEKTSYLNTDSYVICIKLNEDHGTVQLFAKSL